MTGTQEELEDRLRRVLDQAARGVSVTGSDWQGPSPASSMTRPSRAGARVSLRSHRPGDVIALAVALAVTAVVVVVIASVGKRSQPAAAPGSAAAALDEAARAAAAGRLAPRLQRGQAWYTEEVRAYVSPALPGGILPGASREVWWWEGWNGTSGHVSAGSVGIASGPSGTPGPPGFGQWTVSFISAAALHSPASLLRAMKRFGAYFDYNVPGGSPVEDTDTSPLSQLAEAAAILGEAQLRPLQRAVVFRAIARLPGLTYLGPAHDPLGRPGVAVAAEGSPRVLDTNAPQRYRLELIFDPSTGKVLGFRTVALETVQAPAKRNEGVPSAAHVRAGELMFAWAYRRTGVAPIARLPSLVCTTAARPASCAATVSSALMKRAARPARHPAAGLVAPNGVYKIVARIKLAPPDHRQTPSGVAGILRNRMQYAIRIAASGLSPNSAHAAFAVWLTGGPQYKNVLLGLARVGPDRKLRSAGLLPADASSYRHLVVTLEPRAHRSANPYGPVILQGRWTL